MTIRKKWMGLFAAVLVTGCSGCHASTQPPVDAASYVGSLDTDGFSMDVPVYGSLQEMMDDAELIVKGRVSEPPKAYEAGDDIIHSLYAVDVSAVIKGADTQTVMVMQMGDPASDEYETKLRSDNDYLLFLAKAFTRPVEDGGQTVYAAIGVEQGIFEITKADTLKAYSRLGISAQIDGKSNTAFGQELIAQIQNEQNQAVVR